jgi:hypothetical protein
LARLDSGAGWYVRAPLTAASVGRFVSDDCASADRYSVVKDPYGLNFFTVTIPLAASGSSVFLALEVGSPSSVDSTPMEICDSCAFDQGSCQPVTGADRTPVSGSFYVRMDSKSFVAFPGSDVAWSQTRFIW